VVKLTTLKPAIGRMSTSIASIPAKVVDGYYQSAEWKALRKACLQRDLYRCTLALPGCRHTATIADHIVSRRKGGADTIDNLRSVCRVCDNRLKEDHLGERRGARRREGPGAGGG
jgi:5-methylcytosine-specific restriction endonuclease McrA